jgi:hypothetical protein
MNTRAPTFPQLQPDADARARGVMIQVTETVAAHDKTIAMNEALLLGSLHQHELA